jgi:RNA polymerase sigma-70 factor, ECF subfamily
MDCSTSHELGRPACDEELMLAAGRGDPAAFEQLVVRHQTAAWGVAYRFLGDPAEAEDIAQEAFLKILAAAPHYRPSAKFRTYLYRVVARLCLDHGQKRRPVYAQELPEVADDGPSPVDAMTARERARDVRQALDALPAKQRLALVLRYFEGQGYAEIAAVLGTTGKAVERVLARARTALGERLAHLLD